MTQTITIQTDADFTPAGKRRSRVVTTTRGFKQLRWYVGGKIFRKMPVTATNLQTSHEWVNA